MSKLPADCLDEIFEYFEEDKITLRSCLLVNRLWCKISVKSLWIDDWYYCTSNYNTLIACLSKESKELLFKNGIVISTTNSNPPLFNYASFCKILSINRVYITVEKLLLKNQQYNVSSQNQINLIVQELYKLFMIQISPLKELTFHGDDLKINFTSYPGAKNRLKNLSELYCSSNVSSKFFYHLSQFCKNLKSLYISFERFNSKGLSDLISVQKNLKCLSILQHRGDNEVNNIIPLLTTNHSNSLIKLSLYGNYNVSLSFIANFKNLQQLELSFDHNDFEDFEKLQYVILPNLKIFKIPYHISNNILITFLENNGKNLIEFYAGDDIDNSLNSIIANFCPNLKKFYAIFKNSQLDTFKLVFNSCQFLESIKIWCGGDYLSEKEAFDLIINHSHKYLYELILYYQYQAQTELLPDELESFFMKWTNRIPQKSIILIIVNDEVNSLGTNEKNLEIIEKYKKLGVIKKFDVIDCDNDHYN
ncbi:hypothetical protein C1645_828103 [Glomus cerebriforme]|uniref:F-box domain-containing protein n=1 Tax=Glomus cerebriforme TaxID=658196 RepID=A0A397SNF7_9GLOM|nr:hypothetical protein C1645_828103 [Glomus cerebriforme]